VAPDELRGGHPVEGLALREAEVAVEEAEEARVAELPRALLAVEVREGQEEVGEGAVLPAEEMNEAGGEVGGPFHDCEAINRV
jgi:hypothetical protein